MSKSLRNYPDPMMVFDTYGSDAMRWYLLGSPILRGSDLVVTEDGIRDTVRQVILPIWNSWYFLSLYANAAGTTGTFRTDSTDVLDRYILAKTHDLVSELTSTLDEYDLFAACNSVRSFLDALTNWYVRRSRDRFWDGDQAAIDTLHTVLVVLTRVLAPLLPLVTEEVHRGLTGADSVHLQDWPDAAQIPADPQLVEAMDLARDVCNATLRLRKAHQLRVRQPLSSLSVAVPGSGRLQPFLDLVADEVNVKQVDLTDDVASVASFDLQVLPAALGPRLGGQTQQVIKAVKSGDWQRTDGGVVAGGIELLESEYTLRLAVTGDAVSAPLSGGAGVVALDTEVTPALEAEGVTRDLVRLVQQARRAAGLQVSDRIVLTLGVPESIRRQVSAHLSLLTDATLAVSLDWSGGEPNADLDGEPVHLSVVVAG
jgi:isoleucyl-tRNA synthetase